MTLTPVSIPVRERRQTDIETQRSNDQKCFDTSKAITRLPRHDQTVHREINGAIQYYDIIEECKKKKLDDASQRLLNDWNTILAKGGGPKKTFQYCFNPKSSSHFLYLRAIQGHSRENASDPSLQDNALLPKGFTENIFHVGNASELNSRIRNGMIPGGKSLKKRKTSRVLHYSKSNGGWKQFGSNSMRSDKTKSRSIQEFLETPSTYGILVQFEARSRERLAFFQTRSHAVVLFNTTCSLH